MAMRIDDFLIIEVADSDTAITRRLVTTTARSSSQTGSYYTNDDLQKQTEIFDWFNNFNGNNQFYIDVLRTKMYIHQLESNILVHKNLFMHELAGIEQSIKEFYGITIGSDKLGIPSLLPTGQDRRYIKFDNREQKSEKFRNLIIGTITNILIAKKNNQFLIWLELVPNYPSILGLQKTVEKANKAFTGNPITGAVNSIYYGNPGCGKSYLVKRKYEIGNNIVIRTTFSPDYSNSDFLGQILPKLTANGQVFYDFSPGVFTKSLLYALTNPENEVILIIEEINRGNASSIFGDVFQLLDRDETGRSEYDISIPLIEDWLNANNINLKKVFLPSNLSIIATMNTSDQNVFVLDSAFKRRWNMVYVDNDFRSGLIWFDWLVPGSKYTWKEFVIKINEHILDSDEVFSITEDKRIGVFFCDKYSLIDPKDANINKLDIAYKFANKILLYIWDDVSKHNRNEWFSIETNSYDKLLARFIELCKSGLESLTIFNRLFE